MLRQRRPPADPRTPRRRRDLKTSPPLKARPAPVLALAALATAALILACSRPTTPAAEARTAANLADDFSGQRAFDHVRHLVSLGPRPPASDAFETQLRYLEETLANYGWSSSRQTFQARTPIGPVTFTNLLARHSSAPPLPASPPILVGGHIDTKKVDFPFVGANDAGSSTGILLELARVLSARPEAAAKVELVFFDGEEAFRPNITPDDGLYGSRFFARSLLARPRKPTFAVVLDIVGDADFPLFFSPDTPESFASRARRLAAALDFPAGFRPAPGPIIDDHVPLQMVGLPCLHLIGDFTAMDYWHQPGDTLDQLEPEMLENVGRLTLRFLSESGLSAPASGD